MHSCLRILEASTESHGFGGSLWMLSTIGKELCILMVYLVIDLFIGGNMLQK
jgi:hypothetical protein